MDRSQGEDGCCSDTRQVKESLEGLMAAGEETNRSRLLGIARLPRSETYLSLSTSSHTGLPGHFEGLTRERLSDVCVKSPTWKKTTQEDSEETETVTAGKKSPFKETVMNVHRKRGIIPETGRD